MHVSCILLPLQSHPPYLKMVNVRRALNAKSMFIDLKKTCWPIRTSCTLQPRKWLDMMHTLHANVNEWQLHQCLMIYFICNESAVCSQHDFHCFRSSLSLRGENLLTSILYKYSQIQMGRQVWCTWVRAVCTCVHVSTSSMKHACSCLIFFSSVSKTMYILPFSPTKGKDHVKTSMKLGSQYGCGEQLNCRMFITLFSYFRIAAKRTRSRLTKFQTKPAVLRGEQGIKKKKKTPLNTFCSCNCWLCPSW